ncbi:hypothetical protein IC619_005055 [Hazenella sp. IB182353]|uniref:hypothetical protein n=1 Tax=Polycladospora coralii TaxID=2771432 RepID=UPI001746A1AB|nr:hypothetical protein [Polycladospora coralii]MBS7529866.1 hypothetical protein [Polycladospora coralii]
MNIRSILEEASANLLTPHELYHYFSKHVPKIFVLYQVLNGNKKPFLARGNGPHSKYVMGFTDIEAARQVSVAHPSYVKMYEEPMLPYLIKAYRSEADGIVLNAGLPSRLFIMKKHLLMLIQVYAVQQLAHSFGAYVPCQNENMLLGEYTNGKYSVAIYLTESDAQFITQKTGGKVQLKSWQTIQERCLQLEADGPFLHYGLPEQAMLQIEQMKTIMNGTHQGYTVGTASERNFIVIKDTNQHVKKSETSHDSENRLLLQEDHSVQEIQRVEKSNPKEEMVTTAEKDIVQQTAVTAEKDIVQQTAVTAEKDIAQQTDVTAEKDIAQQTDVTAEKDIVQQTAVTTEKDIVQQTEASTEKDIVQQTEASAEKDIAQQTAVTAEEEIVQRSSANRDVIPQSDSIKHGTSLIDSDSNMDVDQDESRKKNDELSQPTNHYDHHRDEINQKLLILEQAVIEGQGTANGWEICRALAELKKIWVVVDPDQNMVILAGQDQSPIVDFFTSKEKAQRLIDNAIAKNSSLPEMSPKLITAKKLYQALAPRQPIVWINRGSNDGWTSVMGDTLPYVLQLISQLKSV